MAQTGSPPNIASHTIIGTLRGLARARAHLSWPLRAVPGSAGECNALDGWFNRNILHNSDTLVVKEHMLTHSILPKNEERC